MRRELHPVSVPPIVTPAVDLDAPRCARTGGSAVANEPQLETRTFRLDRGVDRSGADVEREVVPGAALVTRPPLVQEDRRAVGRRDSCLRPVIHLAAVLDARVGRGAGEQ